MGTLSTPIHNLIPELQLGDLAVGLEELVVTDVVLGRGSQGEVRAGEFRSQQVRRLVKR